MYIKYELIFTQVFTPRKIKCTRYKGKYVTLFLRISLVIIIIFLFPLLTEGSINICYLKLLIRQLVYKSISIKKKIRNLCFSCYKYIFFCEKYIEGNLI